LIPAVQEIVEKIDLAAGKLIIDPPEGLLDL
jgi:ribosomal 30S subunit maturation factor RimM